MSKTYFDRLPSEIIHEIFSYFSSHEIFQSFYSLSHYIDNIIQKYDNYHLDFSLIRMRKKEFDIICSLIHPEQIIGLKFGLNSFLFIEKYLIHHNNRQRFSRLQSFWLEKSVLYSEQLLQWINLHIDYKILRLFRFDSMDERFFSKHLIFSFEKLSHLVGCSSELFRKLSKQIPMNLTFLHMFFNSIDDLISLLNLNSYQLKSLGIGIKCNSNDIIQFSSLFKNYQWKKLIQFNLNLQMNNVQWTTIEEILSPMNKLRYLTLIFSKQNSMNNRLFDGNQWKNFFLLSLPYLIKFDLQLPVDIRPQLNISSYLNQFQTSWWLDEKHWYMEYLTNENAFVTVPYFVKRTCEISDIYLYSRMSKPNIFYSNIAELKLNLDQFNGLGTIYFNHIKHLSLNGTLTINQSYQIQHCINMKNIEYFEIVSDNDQFSEYIKLLLDMTQLSSLKIQCQHSLDLFRLISSPLVSIRHLVLLDCEETTVNEVYSKLCHLFSNLVKLTCKYQSRKILSYLLNHLVFIEHIEFLLNENNHVPNHRWIEEHTRLTFDSFRSDILNINHKERSFIIWINQDKNTDQMPSHHEHQKCFIQ